MNPGYINDTIREAIPAMNTETQLDLIVANKIAVEVHCMRGNNCIVTYYGEIKQPSRHGWYYVLVSRGDRDGKTVAYEFKLERVQSVAGNLVTVNML